jgi:hypothetical protein
VFRFNGITKIDLVIVIGIKGTHDLFSVVIDIFTVPSIITSWAFIWIGTVEHVISFFTVSNSPFIFTFDDTVVDFTGSEGTIIVLVTIFDEEFEMFSIDVIT